MKKRKGSALIMMIAVVAVLIVFSTCFVKSVASSYVTNQYFDKSDRLYMMAQSGMDMGLNQVKTKNSIKDINNLESYDKSISCDVIFKDGSDFKDGKLVDDASKCTIESTATFKKGKTGKRTIRAVLNKSETKSFNHSMFIDNSINTLRDINNSNNTITINNGKDNKKSNMSEIGPVCFNGYSAEINGNLTINGDMNAVCKDNFNLKDCSNNVVVNGNTNIKSYNTINISSALTTNDLIVDAGGDIEGSGGLIKAINGSAFMKSGGNISLFGKYHIKNGDMMLKASKDISFQNDALEIGKNFYANSLNGSINFPNLKLNTGVNSNVSIIANNKLDFCNGPHSLLGTNYLKANEIDMNCSSINLGNIGTYIEADTFKSGGDSSITYDNLKTYVVNMKPSLKNAVPTGQKVIDEPVFPQESKPLTESGNICPVKTTSYMENFDSKSKSNIDYIVIRGKDPNGNDSNAVKTALTSAPDDKKYKLIVIDGDCTFNENDVTEGKGDEIDLKNTIIYCTGNIQMTNVANIYFTNSVIYTNAMNSNCFLHMTPIGRNPVIPFTKGTVDDINSVLESSLLNYAKDKNKDNYIVRDDEVDSSTSNCTYTFESYK